MFLFAGAALGELIGRYQKTLKPVLPAAIIVLFVILYMSREHIMRIIMKARPEAQPEARPEAQPEARPKVQPKACDEAHLKAHLQNILCVSLSRIYGFRLLIMVFSLCLVLGNCRMLSERFLYEEYESDDLYNAEDTTGSLQEHDIDGDDGSRRARRSIDIGDVLRRSVTQTAVLDELSREKSCTRRCRVDSIVPRSEGYLVRSGQLNLYCDESAASLKIGNKVDFTGQISRISSPRNPGEWDYAASSLASGITHRMYVKEMAIADAGVSWPGQKMYELRAFLLDRISSSFQGEDAEDDAAFLRAALLGDKSLMSDEMYDMYKSNGIAHLLAISGLHISIIGLSLYRFIHDAVLRMYREFFIKRHPLEEVLNITGDESFLLPDLAAGAVSVTFLIFYSVLTGSSVSTVRAAFMMILMFFASINGRTYDLLSAAAMSGLCIILYRPFQLFNCSFLLSFGAVAAIGGPAVYIIKRYDIRNSLLSSIIVSLCIQLVTLPIASAFFFEISTYGIFLNLLVIPLMTYVVWSGLASIVVPAAGGGAHYLLHFFKWLCGLASGLPHRSILLGRPMVMLTAFVTWITPVNASDQITFLDVGQGDGIYISMAGENILVDGGSSSSKSMGKYTLEPFLKSSRVSRLDRVFVTHADTDHISGIRYLLAESDIKISRLYLPLQALEDDAYDDLKEEAEHAGTRLIYLKQGDVVEPGFGLDIAAAREDGGKTAVECTISCLWPDADTSTEDMNNESLVLLVQSGGFTSYLAGDAGVDAESSILGEYTCEIHQVDVLKCGHHGSSTSTSQELLESIRPHWAVLSYKEGNIYGHPHREVCERLEKYGVQQLHTAKNGAVTFVFTGKRVLVRKFC